MRKVQRGDPLRIPAEAYNAFIDTARAHRASQHNLDGSGEQSERFNSGVVLVRNESGQDRERFNILTIDGPVFDPVEAADSFKNRIVLKGKTPTDSDAGNFLMRLARHQGESATCGELSAECEAIQPLLRRYRSNFPGPFTKETDMWYVGLDAHTKRSSICVSNERGEIRCDGTIRRGGERVVEFLRRLIQPLAICFEAACSYSPFVIKPASSPSRIVLPGRSVAIQVNTIAISSMPPTSE